MDCDKCWECVEKVYKVIVNVEGEKFEDLIEFVKVFYVNDKNDEFVVLVIIIKDGKFVVIVKDNDVVIFFNFCFDCVI